MSTDTREALAALMVIAAECAQRKPLRGFEELTEATHIGHRQFGRAHEKADEAVRMLAVRLRAVFDTLAAALATQPAQPSAQGEAVALKDLLAKIHALACSGEIGVLDVQKTCGGGCYSLWDEIERAIRASAPAAPAQPSAQGEAVAWRPIKTAPRNGTSLLLRFGIDGVSQGKYVPGIPHPWKFIDTNDGITWLVNHAIDGPGGPSHWMHLPSADLSPDFHAAPAAPAQAVPLTDELEAALEALVNRCNADFVLAADDAVIAAEAALERLHRARVAHGIKAAQPNTPTK